MSDKDQSAFLAQLWLMTMFLTDDIGKSISAFLMALVFMYLSYKSQQ